MGSTVYDILDVSQFCCLILDSEYKVIYANKKSIEAFGDELIGLSIDRISPTRQSSGQPSVETMRGHLAIAATVGKKRFAWEACDLNGQPLPHPFEVDAAALEIDDKTHIVMYYNVLGHNCVGCTNLKERRDAEEITKTITEHMPVVCITFDANYNVLDCNQAAVERYGMKDKQDLLTNFNKYVLEFQPDGKPSQQKARQLINQALEEGVVTFEWMNQSAAGDLMPTEVTLVRAEKQEEYYVMAFQRDLRDFYKYKEMEYTLMQRSGAMLDASPLMCSIFDEKCNIIATNRKAEELFEIPDKQIYIDNFLDFSPKFQPDGTVSQEKAAEMLAEAHRNGHTNFVWLHQTRDGKPIPTEIYLKRVVLEGRNQVIAYTRDLR